MGSLILRALPTRIPRCPPSQGAARPASGRMTILDAMATRRGFCCGCTRRHLRHTGEAEAQRQANLYSPGSER